MMQEKDALGLTKPEEWELTALCELAKVVARTIAGIRGRRSL